MAVFTTDRQSENCWHFSDGNLRVQNLSGDLELEGFNGQRFDWLVVETEIRERA